MQNEELTQTYLSKSEDELLKLLSESGDLMPEARAALFSEAARRGLKVPAFAESTRELPDIDVKEQALAAGPFIAEVLRTFHSRFWAFVKLVGPAVVIGYVAVYWSGQEIRGIASRLRYL